MIGVGIALLCFITGGGCAYACDWFHKKERRSYPPSTIWFIGDFLSFSAAILLMIAGVAIGAMSVAEMIGR